MTRRYLLAAVLMVVCGLTGAWINRTLQERGSFSMALAESSSPDDGVATDTTQDQRCVALLKQSNRGEALGWLAQAGANRGVVGWEKPDASELIRKFYSAGAVKVFVVDTQIVNQTEVASQFVVELPDNPAARTRVFDEEAAFEAEYDDAPTPDVGQKYLHLTTD